jgi:hypothetical protein
MFFYNLFFVNSFLIHGIAGLTIASFDVIRIRMFLVFVRLHDISHLLTCHEHFFAAFARRVNERNVRIFSAEAKRIRTLTVPAEGVVRIRIALSTLDVSASTSIFIFKDRQTAVITLFSTHLYQAFSLFLILKMDTRLSFMPKIFTERTENYLALTLVFKIFLIKYPLLAVRARAFKSHTFPLELFFMPLISQITHSC